MTTIAGIKTLIDAFEADPDPAEAIVVLRKIGLLIETAGTEQIPIPPDQPDVIEDAIEQLAVDFLDQVKTRAEADVIAPINPTRGIGKLAALIRAGRDFNDVIQTFAGFLTEHTMAVYLSEPTVQQGGSVRTGIKLQDQRGAIIDRIEGNGDN